jgi:hypothetical protein
VGAAGAVAVVGAAITAAAVGFGGSDPDPAATGGNLPPATATVTRTTLTQTTTVTGTLGYGDPTTVAARSGGTGGGAPGTVTWLPSVGSTVSRGRLVYAVDAQPVVLLYGSTPLYRTLSPGVEGADVRLLERNLSALGYSGFTVDDEYTDATADAVRAWQEDLGRDETGMVKVGEVVVAPAAIRVTEHKTSLGNALGGPVLVYTGTKRLVTVDLDVADQELVAKGTTATIDLPDGRSVSGSVTSVGTVASSKTTGTGTQAQTTTTVDVEIGVRDQKALGRYDGAPVDVVLVSDRRENVLAVPVNALVALVEGGYGVQVVQGSTTRYVAVKTGLFAGGKVEISGAGIASGMTVGIPK